MRNATQGSWGSRGTPRQVRLFAFGYDAATLAASLRRGISSWPIEGVTGRLTLAADGRSLSGEPQRLLSQDQSWEEPLIENPTLAFDQGRYYLLYSANWWESEDYAVGYGICKPGPAPQGEPVPSRRSR